MLRQRLLARSLWWFDLNASWTDIVDGSGVVIGRGEVDVSSPGVNVLSFNYTDTAGNAAATVARTVKVYNTTPKELESIGSLRIQENEPVGTLVGRFRAVDPNGNRIYYKLIGEEGNQTNDLFALDVNGTLRSAKVFDFETDEHNITVLVSVTDEYNASISKPFLVSLDNVVEDNDQDGVEDHFDSDDDNDGFTDEEELAFGSDPLDANSVVNQPPSDILIEGGEVVENQEVGTLVARFSGVDADDDDMLRYKLSGQENNSSLPFRLSPAGILKTSRVLDYEADDHNYTISVRVTDDLNTSFQKQFIIHLTNIVEDIDGDGVEDTYDEDQDGDKYSNDVEIEQGTDPKDPHFYPNKPILKTDIGVLNEDGSIDLSGGIVEDGNGKITDFGFVLSSGISLDRKKSNVLWIKGGGEPEGFILKLTQSPYQPLLYIRAWAKNIAGYGIGPVRKVRIPEAPKSWWGEVQERPGGWKTSDWFGNFINYERGWLYHARLGWLYSSSTEEEGVWLWREENGWLWTKQDVWPYLWSHHSGHWLYLYPGKFGGSPKFYDYSIQSYR